MLMTDYNLRMPFTISSSDDQTTQSAKMYLKKIIDGSLGVIGEQKLFKALSVTPTNSKQTATFADLYGYQQFIIAQLNNTIGLATNNNMKRERLTTNEIEVNKNASYPLVDNMLKNRQQAVDAINKMFDADISVEYSSIWRGINDNSDNSISDNGNDENNTTVPTNDNTIAVNSDKAVNVIDKSNGNSDSNNSTDGDNQPVISGDEQPKETNQKSEQPANENVTTEPQADNEPTEKTRATSKEKVNDEQENNDTDNNDKSDGNDENVSDNTSDDDTPSNDDDVPDNEPSNDDEKKKERDKK